MGGISAGGGNSKSDKLNTELSLVPFIDLLSTLVLFLLLSAVWIQMGSLPTSVQSSGVSKTSDVDTSKVTISVQTGPRYQITWPKTVSGEASSVDDLQKVIPKIESLVKQNKITSASVSGVDTVSYGTVIRTIDLLKRTGLVSVGMSTN